MQLVSYFDWQVSSVLDSICVLWPIGNPLVPNWFSHFIVYLVMFPFILLMQDVCNSLFILISMSDFNLYCLTFFNILVNYICMYELTIQQPGLFPCPYLTIATFQWNLVCPCLTKEICNCRGCYLSFAEERLMYWAHGSDGQITQRLSAWCWMIYLFFIGNSWQIKLEGLCEENSVKRDLWKGLYNI